jgi:hypothetical protein
MQRNAMAKVNDAAVQPVFPPAGTKQSVKLAKPVTEALVTSKAQGGALCPVAGKTTALKRK